MFILWGIVLNSVSSLDFGGKMENIQFFSLEPELSEEMEGYKGEEMEG